MRDQLPSQETIELPERLSLTEIIDLLPPDFSDELTMSQQNPSNGDSDQQNEVQESKGHTIDERSFAFAFLGWDVVKDGSSGLLECRACFRRLGLWLYKPKEQGKDPIYDKLPVHSEHMDYCPWINGTAQSGTGNATDKTEDLLSGWQVLAQDIRTKHRRRVKGATPSKDSQPAESDALSLNSTAADEASARAKDKEWWSKLRRMRDVLHVKGPRKSISTDKST